MAQAARPGLSSRRVSRCSTPKARSSLSHIDKEIPSPPAPPPAVSADTECPRKKTDQKEHHSESGYRSCPTSRQSDSPRGQSPFRSGPQYHGTHSSDRRLQPP